jgi:single-strand DNA-binding protein
MKNLRNRVQLIGNLGSDPEINETSNGLKYTKISIATNSMYTNKNGEKIKDTQWHPIVLWGKLAEFANDYTTKGQEVCLEGKLNYRSYEDNEGNKKDICEIIASEILLLKK